VLASLSVSGGQRTVIGLGAEASYGKNGGFYTSGIELSSPT